MSITTEINDWQIGRTNCLAREATNSGSRWNDEIQGYDDDATRLLDQVAPLVAAAEALMDLDLDMWADNATAFSCGEAEAIAQVIRVVHDDQTALDFLIAHAELDDEGDDHFHLNDDQSDLDDDR
jgi:hypothetical protein